MSQTKDGIQLVSPRSGTAGYSGIVLYRSGFHRDMEEEIEDNGLMVSSDIWSMLGLRLPMADYEVDETLFVDFGERIRLCLHYYNKAIHWKRRLDERIDLRSCVLNLAAAVEGIVNESIVQYIRMKMGVKMPDYYCKWAEGVEDLKIRTTKRLDVKFNKYFFDLEKNRRLKVVSIGDIGEVLHSLDYRDMYKDDEVMARCYDKEFVSTLRLIAKIRGEATHGSKVEDVEAFDKMIDAYRKLEKYVGLIKEVKEKCC